MAGNQTDNIQLLDLTTGLPRTPEAADNIQSNSTWEFLGDVVFKGTVVEKVREEVRIADNHLFLNDGYTTAAAQTAGLVANYLPIATTDTVAGSGFTAGIAATSNPTVGTTGAATFAVGQFIMITGANTEGNNGLYEVLSHSSNVLTIRGVGTTGTVEDFTEDQFTTDTNTAGSITRLNVSIMRAGTDGAWETANGSTTGLTFTDVGAGATTTLQQAYDNDPDGGDATIATNSTDGSVVIAGTESLQVTATLGLDVDTRFDADVTVFDVLMTGANGFSIDGTAASNVSVDAGNLTLSTTSSGNVIVNSVANVDMDAVDVLIDATGSASIDAATSSNLTVAGTDAGALNLTLSATNAGAGTGNVLIAADDEVDVTSASLDVNTSGATTVDAASFSIDGTSASNVSVTGGNLTLSTITTGSVNITSVGDSTYTVPNASATAWSLTDGSDTYARVDSVRNALELPSFVDVSAGPGLGVVLTTDDALIQGDIVNIEGTTGNVALADADTGTIRDGLVVGVSDGTYGAAGLANIVTVPGCLIPVRFVSAPAASANGTTVYLSTTAGQAALTIPGGANRVVFKIGILQGANGASTTPLVLFQPQFISNGPQAS